MNSRRFRDRSLDVNQKRLWWAATSLRSPTFTVVTLLRYLLLFNTINGTSNPPGRLPKPLWTHGKRASKKNGKAVTCCALKGTLYHARRRPVSQCFGVGYRNYKTPTTPGRELNRRTVHQGQPRTKRGLCLALVGALELLSAADWNCVIFWLNLQFWY
jgi:hypothetical protein